MKKVKEYTDIEFMICVTGRIPDDNTTAFVGIGMPQTAFALAQKLYVPNAQVIYEYGTWAPQSKTPFEPFVMAQSKTDYKALAWQTMNTVFSASRIGFIDYGILGASQIDQYGNINSTMLGDDYFHPKVRFPGTGGADNIASQAWKTIIVMRHEKRRFVEHVDFISSPGFLDGSLGAREKIGLPKGTGPYRLVTSMAIFGYDEETRKMKLLSIAPKVSLQEVVDNMSFEPIMPEKIEELEAPTDEELRVLRQELDPERAIIGKGKIIRLD